MKLDPEFEEAKYYLADTYILEEKPAAALPLLEALVHAQPRDARALADQGKALEKLNRDTEAARAYEACLRVDPERADAHYRLARVYKKLKRSDESARELATAKRLRQRNARNRRPSCRRAARTVIRPGKGRADCAFRRRTTRANNHRTCAVVNIVRKKRESLDNHTTLGIFSIT